MRTTVDIPDALYRKLKARAAEQGTTVKALVLESLEVRLSMPEQPARKKLKLPVMGAEVQTQRQAWETYHRILDSPGVRFLDERFSRHPSSGRMHICSHLQPAMIFA
jgi:plasmid stability protein